MEDNIVMHTTWGGGGYTHNYSITHRYAREEKQFSSTHTLGHACNHLPPNERSSTYALQLHVVSFACNMNQAPPPPLCDIMHFRTKEEPGARICVENSHRGRAWHKMVGNFQGRKLSWISKRVSISWRKCAVMEC